MPSGPLAAFGEGSKNFSQTFERDIRDVCGALGIGVSKRRESFDPLGLRRRGLHVLAHVEKKKSTPRK